ncbi:hypothetical protein AAG570_006108 [Ranatra chinensis]|uniref:Sodium channel modifier 1 zinc-finger domain-containing protein n=1 Tax=Ranatra chinensis TaxID=642074 RepID=A0ABD0Y9Y7_9HEMI
MASKRQNMFYENKKQETTDAICHPFVGTCYITAFHQRVTDLLESYIPDEEAKLLSNGRFTCLVCDHRPIFDTIKMLAIHRKGKRHLQELSKYIKRKSYLELETLKKEQLGMIAAEDEPNRSDEPNPPILPSGNSDYFSVKLKRKFSRRKALEIPTFIDEIETKKSHQVPSPSLGPSSASQVRHYLKQLPRKVSFKKTVEKTLDEGPPPYEELKSVTQPSRIEDIHLVKSAAVKSVAQKNSGTGFSQNM